jgi:uncharacterized repeat protein (TIGR03803 family)
MKTRMTTLPDINRSSATIEQKSRGRPVWTLFLQAFLVCLFGLLPLGVSAGVVFTSLHSFQVSSNGASPSAGLVQGNDGYFYGTTQYGGTNGSNGTVFKIGTNGVLISLHSFTGGNDGNWPQAGLVLGHDG